MRNFIVMAVLILAAYIVDSVGQIKANPLAVRDAALCDTDTDCLKRCPPDDAQCDGGPQS